MVLLRITPLMLEAMKERDESRDDDELGSDEDAEQLHPSDVTIGSPISHARIVDLHQSLKRHGKSRFSLEKLLRGSQVYIPPATPKPAPSEEYKALMARLRRDEEARSYARMVKPISTTDTFASRFPNAFAAVNAPHSEADLGDDTVTVDEVHRQVTLIINFLVSMAGVAATLWFAARWWTLPARLALAMGGSILVGVAEVAVYSGYVWRMGEGKKLDDKKKETREVAASWAVGEGVDEVRAKVVGKEESAGAETVRRRFTGKGDQK